MTKFFGLPDELIVEILNKLSLDDLVKFHPILLEYRPDLIRLMDYDSIYRVIHIINFYRRRQPPVFYHIRYIRTNESYDKIIGRFIVVPWNVVNISRKLFIKDKLIQEIIQDIPVRHYDDLGRLAIIDTCDILDNTEFATFGRDEYVYPRTKYYRRDMIEDIYVDGNMYWNVDLL
jgi:hypothetical protein